VRRVLFLAVISCLFSVPAFCAPYLGKEFEFHQPDGSPIAIRVWGDEFYIRAETLDGYSLVRDPVSGFICYAEVNNEGSDFISTGIPYTGQTVEKLKYSGLWPLAQGNGIKKGLRLKHQAVIEKADRNRHLLGRDQLGRILPAPDSDAFSAGSAQAGSPAPLIGEVVGLTLLIQFPDVPATISQADIDNYCNQVGYTGYGNNGSVRDYFYDVSSGNLTYTNYVTVYYTAQHNRSYYTNPNISYGTRASELIQEALLWLDNPSGQNFNFGTISTDGGNYMLAINAFYAGEIDNAWAEGLWPHMSSMYGMFTSNEGVKSGVYQITNIGSSLALGTFCHENGHMICDYPDLYDYGGQSCGAGNYCLMAYGGSAYNPIPPNPYLRDIKGWESVTVFPHLSGVQYFLLSNSNTSYKYLNPDNSKEFFYIDSRTKTGRNSSLPDDGLVIWHIDENGNNDNEQMTPSLHYLVSVEQADGLFHLEYGDNAGESDDLFHAGYKDDFNDTTVPDAKWWNGNDSNLVIRQISDVCSTMSFVYDIVPQPPVAQAGSTSTQINTFVPITLVATDDGLPNPPGVLSYIITSLPTNGSLSDPGAGGITAVPYTVAGNGNQVIYTPTTGYSGLDSFKFKANDGGVPPDGGDSNLATVSVDVDTITVEYQVSASNDDVYAYGSTSQIATTFYLKIGYSPSYGIPYFMSGMRFTNLYIPATTPIVSAHLKIRSYSSYLTRVYGKIQGEDTDNAANFYGRYISGLVKTTASVNWDISTAWLPDTLYSSPDITSVVQEIIDRPGWSPGNALAILYSTRTASGSYRYFSSYDHGSSYAPRLEVTYIRPVTLTTSVAGCGSVTTPGQGVFYYRRGISVPINATPCTSYHFVNWTGTAVTAGKVDDPNSASTTVLMDADHTVQANFAIDQRTLTVSSSGGGSVTQPGIGAFQYAHGTVVDLNAVPSVGCHFVNWTGDTNTIADSNAAVTTITMDANYAIQANFSINQYPVTATSGPNGSIDPQGTIVVNYGDNLCFTAAPNTCYEVNEWYLDGNNVQTGGNYCLNSITANHTVYVTFKTPAFTVTASSDANGSVQPSSAVVNCGASQDFNAIPNFGYQVAEWFVDGNSVQAGGITYTLPSVTANHTVYVTFKELIFVISGYVFEQDGNTPVEGVPIRTDGNDVNTVTDANGFYELWVDYNWSGIVTPQKEGYVFEPNSDTYANVIEDYSDQNYIATLKTFVISGYVFDKDYVTPINDVNVSAENGGGGWTSRYGGGSWLTDANGYYEVVVDYNWSGKVVPAKYAYAFEPNKMEYVNVKSDSNDQDYIGTLLTFTISGHIKNSCDVPIAGVLVDANNGGGQNTTDVNGFYEVWVDYNWSGTVTPTKGHHTFNPGEMVYVDVLADQPDQNYVAHNIYDLDCDGSIGFGDLRIVSENWLDGPDLPGDFYKDEDDIVNFLDFAEFAKHWLE